MSRILVLAAALLAVVAQEGAAQSWLERAKQKAKQKVEERVDRRTEQAIDRTLDAGEGAAKCAATESACAGGATQSAAPTSAPASAPTGEAATAPAAATTAAPGEGAWVNYDFKPGERPLFVDDFSRDAVGDFPRRLEFKEGNMEVAEWQGRRWLRATGGKGEFFIPLRETLPERFTIEFDYAGLNKYELKLTFNGDPGNPEDQVVIGAWGSGIQGDQVRAIAKMPEQIEKRTVRVRVMADGRYVKVYVDSQRVANVPNANLGRTNRIHVALPAYGESAALLADLRVMAGGRDLYDALAEKGRVATQGIYFATGSDVIRPESTPTLAEIGRMLAEHPELKLTIEGHTDDVGQAAANQKLSEKRAAAVKAYLVAKHGVAEERLAIAGYGASRPAAPNDTPEGRQANRRVELVRR